MSRYIDADEAEKWLKAGCAYVIRELPSIDIVRCKDCKHRYTIDCFRAYLEYDIQEWIVDSGDDNDFCSWGERKESE